MKSTLMATVIASVVGTGTWLVGLSQRLWPAHPMIATLMVTVVAYSVARLSWPSKITR